MRIVGDAVIVVVAAIACRGDVIAGGDPNMVGVVEWRSSACAHGASQRDPMPADADIADVDDDACAFDALDDGLAWSLGFLERVPEDEAYALTRHYFPSKCGGAPAWLDPVRVPYASQLVSAKGDKLDFLLQVYAAVECEEPSAFHRTVFVFVNASGGETHARGGCRAFRSQLPRENAYYAIDPLPEGMRGHALDAELDAVRKARCDRWDVTASEAAATLRAPTRTYPEYELVVENEDRATDPTEGMQIIENNVGDDMTADDLDEIEADVYDKDNEQLATFHVMLKSDPDQVLRYCYDDGAKPLWPSVTHAPSEDNIPCCERCGAPRKFEFQILPTIISKLDVDAESDYALDFGSIAVYTCSKSCAPIECDEASQKSGAYAEEYVLVHPPLNQ